MKILRGRLYVVDFNPRVRTKPGQIRPAVVIQDDIVNEAGYPSTIVVPATTKLVDMESPLRLRLAAGTGGLEQESDLLVAQVVAVSYESFRKELGTLPADAQRALDSKLRQVLGL